MNTLVKGSRFSLNSYIICFHAYEIVTNIFAETQFGSLDRVGMIPIMGRIAMLSSILLAQIPQIEESVGYCLGAAKESDRTD